jgi:hypothetical protein
MNSVAHNSAKSVGCWNRTRHLPSQPPRLRSLWGLGVEGGRGFVELRKRGGGGGGGWVDENFGWVQKPTDNLRVWGQARRALATGQVLAGQCQSHQQPHRPAKRKHDVSLGELGQADRLTDRIFAPNGLPDLQSSGWLDIEEDTSELPTGDHALERGEQDAIKAGIACSESVHAVIRHGLLLPDTRQRRMACGHPEEAA